jgi:hypothetical protein
MAIRVAKIDTEAAVPVIELTVIEAPRRTAKGYLRLADAAVLPLPNCHGHVGKPHANHS